jgi:hypothetical protein
MMLFIPREINLALPPSGEDGARPPDEGCGTFAAVMQAEAFQVEF